MSEQSKLRRGAMLEGPEWKSILRFALPIMLGQLLQQLYATVDGVVVGNYVSMQALAAVGTASVVTVGLSAIAFGMSTGCSIAVGQYFGAQRRDDMRKTAATALVLLAGLGLVTLLFGVLAAGFIAKDLLSIREADVCAYAAMYLRVYSLGFVAQFVYNSISSILRSVGDSRAALYFLIISALANVVLDLLFVAVLGWSVAGAAAATVIAQFACAAVSFAYMYRKYDVFRFRLREIRADREKLRLCVKLGVPTSLQHVVVACGNLALQRLIDSFGGVTMAAYTVGRTFDRYMAVPCLGMFQSMTSFAGQNTGAGRYDRVKRGVVHGVCIAVIAVVVLGAVVLAFAAPLSAMFGVEGEAQSQAIAYLRFIAVAYPLMAMYLPFSGTFQGCGDPMAAATAAMVALSARVGSAYLMVYAFHMGHSSGWKSYAVGWASALIFVLIHFARGKWKTKSIVKNTPDPAPQEE